MILIAVSFDESITTFVQESQMDLIIRFWDKEADRTSTYYLLSVFIGQSTAGVFETFVEDVKE